MGNICRSPAALVVTRTVAQRAGLTDMQLDSGGCHGYHVGEAPDRRMQQAAARRGYDLSGVRARKVTANDLVAFDLVLAMDRSNLADLERICAPQHRHKLGLFLDYADCVEAEVPDPYYGGEKGFDHVLDLIETGAQGLIKQVTDPTAGLLPRSRIPGP